MRKANAKEIFAAFLVLLTGGVYLAAQADALFAIGSTTIKGDVIQLSKNELFSHLRTIITIVLCFAGGVLLLKRNKAGWVICVAILCLLLTIAVGIFLSNVQTVNAAAFVLLLMIVLLLMSVIFLLLKPTRNRFNVMPKNYFQVLVFFSVLVAFYFFLQ